MYSLTPWTNPRDDNDVRLYINGTTRTGVYFKRAAVDGRLVWSSRTNTTPTKNRTGDHYGKVEKDRAAANRVAEAFGLRLGEDEWARALELATTGATASDRDDGDRDEGERGEITATEIAERASGIGAGEKVIHTVSSAKWTKFGKWRVELQIRDAATVVAWMTDAQYDYLRSAFAYTRDGFSGHGVDVIGEFDEAGRYQRCSAARVPGKPRHHTPLIEEGGADGALLDQN